MATPDWDTSGINDDEDATRRFKARQSERERVQKKTFTKWINSQLTTHRLPGITDLFTDLRDGTQLLTLLQLLTGVPLRPEIGRMRVHHLNNVSQVLQLLDQHYNIKLVNISSDDIVDGNPKLTLGLVWNIIQHWQMDNILKPSKVDVAGSSVEKALLEWCQQSTQGYRNIDLQNFTSSWRDGLAFNALLHHFHPELFDYERLVGADSSLNLEHAFAVGHSRLGIPRLLDPEDVNVDQPDAKSIMMYVMCCYQMLTGNNSSRQLDLTAAGVSTPMDVDAVDSAIDPTSFQGELESLLAWLLEAQDTLSRQGPISDNVRTVKEQFQDHEEFMVRLTEQQLRIGRVLHAGAQLVANSSTTDDDVRQIEAQMALLNRHWEELRLDAMARQTSLQQVLTELQQQQLDKLSDWLTTMEAYLGSDSRVGSGSDRETIEQQLEKHKLLQEEVEKEQEQVNGLQNMVVVVDETNSDEAYTALERQLESLGQRWGNVCRAIEEQGLALQLALGKWKTSDKLHKQFSRWLNRADEMLGRMTAVDGSSEMLLVVEQVRQLKVLERECDDWIPQFEELNASSKQLAEESAGNDELVQQLQQQMKSLQDRWNALVQAMERKSNEIMLSGVEIKEVKGESGSLVLTVSRRIESKTVTQTVTLPRVVTSVSQSQQLMETDVSMSVTGRTFDVES